MTTKNLKIFYPLNLLKPILDLFYFTFTRTFVTNPKRFCLNGQTIHKMSCLIATMCKDVDHCQNFSLEKTLYHQIRTSFSFTKAEYIILELLAASSFMKPSTGSRHWQYKAPEVHLISQTKHPHYSKPHHPISTEVQHHIIQCLPLSSRCPWRSCWWLQCVWLMPRRGLRCVVGSWYVWLSHPVGTLAPGGASWT